MLENKKSISAHAFIAVEMQLMVQDTTDVKQSMADNNSYLLYLGYFYKIFALTQSKRVKKSLREVNYADAACSANNIPKYNQ